MAPWVESIDVVSRHDGYAIRSRTWIGDEPHRRLATTYENGYKAVETATADALARAKNVKHIRHIGIEQGNIIRSIQIW
ncbi:hypothetical protein C4568_04365 [Candidatus Parcubacteria bacterium]|nr:MAG: hypothetical protein C4568_04365 [Candidatus Parcubacteria bacterium]